jgi:hypothetical protein
METRPRILALAGLALGALLTLAAPVAATASPHEGPVDLAGAYVLDRAEVLDAAGAQQVQQAVDDLYASRGTKLFVVYVDAFTGAAIDDWADDTAELSGLGTDDVLLAIAVDDRAYRWSVPTDFALDGARLDEIASERLIPRLRVDDWAGGAAEFAAGLDDAQAPSIVPWVLGGGVLAVGAVAGGTVLVRRRIAASRTKKAQREADDRLERTAGAALLALDDALAASGQELGFAEAQFGADAVRDFQTALAAARTTAQQAFALQQKLDDAEPETPDERRALWARITELAGSADAALDDQADAFDELRALEKDAATVLETVATEQAGLAARVAGAETKVAELRGTSPEPPELAAVADSPAQAAKLAAFAAASLQKARDAIAAERSADAAVAVRAAQQAVGQAGALLAAVDAAVAEASARAARRAAAGSKLEGALADATAQVDATQSFIETRRGAVAISARTRVSEARRRLAETGASASSDPEKALTEAQQAAQLAAQALDLARQDVARARQVDAARGDEAVDGADGAGLGGILGELFGGGGTDDWWSGGSRSSGSSWGGSWGGFGGSSRRSGSSFGGSSRSSSRSSGSSSRRSGGSSSGGRRSGGGRF